MSDRRRYGSRVWYAAGYVQLVLLLGVVVLAVVAVPRPMSPVLIVVFVLEAGLATGLGVIVVRRLHNAGWWPRRARPTASSIRHQRCRHGRYGCWCLEDPR